MEQNEITLKELLGRIHRDLSRDAELSAKNRGRRVLKLSKAADVLAKSAGTLSETAGIGLLVDGEAEFLRHLHGNGLGTSALSRNIRGRDRLLRYAMKFGLLLPGTLNGGWERLLEEAGYEHCVVRSIVVYAKIQGLSSVEFGPKDLNGWRKQRVQEEGILTKVVDDAEKAFRRVIREGKLQKLFPRIDVAKRTKPPFSLFIEDMEMLLKTDVSGIIDWARIEAANRTLRIGESIRIQLEALCGYAVTILNIEDLNSVDSLLTEEFLIGYVLWLHVVRERSRASIRPLISGLHTILLHYPRFAEQKIMWWPNVLGTIDREPNSATEDHREARALPYEELLAALKRMRRARLSLKGLSSKTIAWMAHDEVLLRLAVLHVFHPGLLYSCRVIGPDKNVFNDEVQIDRPKLVLTPAAERAWEHDHHVHLWQFDFEREWGVGSFGVIIDAVAPLLDEYMTKHRKELVKGREDPGTLFFSRRITPLCKHTLNHLIAKLTLNYAGKRVTADTMRISFIDYWLIEHERDYVNLANILMISLDSVQQRFDPDYKSAFGRGRSTS
jgi:hypothetical protein